MAMQIITNDWNEPRDWVALDVSSREIIDRDEDLDALVKRVGFAALYTRNWNRPLPLKD